MYYVRGVSAIGLYHSQHRHVVDLHVARLDMGCSYHACYLVALETVNEIVSEHMAEHSSAGQLAELA